VISSKNGGTAMLIDFNSAKLIEDETIKLDKVTGTEMYSAPELKEVGRC